MSSRESEVNWRKRGQENISPGKTHKHFREETDFQHQVDWKWESVLSWGLKSWVSMDVISIKQLTKVTFDFWRITNGLTGTWEVERLLKNNLEILGLGSVPFHNSVTLHYSKLMFYHVWNDKRKVVSGSLVLRMAQMGANMSEGGFRFRIWNTCMEHGHWCLDLPVPLSSSSELLVIDVNALSYKAVAMVPMVFDGLGKSDIF